MFRNYFTIAWRNLVRNKSFSAINILGLAVGMASAALIFLWCQYVSSADQFHTKIDRLYEVYSNDKVGGSIRSLNVTPEIMAPELKKDYPEIEAAARANWTRNLLFIPTTKSTGPKSFLSVGFTVDPAFLTMFSFPFVAGDPNTALDDPHGMVITQSLAKRLFQNEDPIGQTVRMGNDDLFKVTAILRDINYNSAFRDMEYLCHYGQHIDSSWEGISVPTYVLLKPNARAATLNEKFKHLIPTRSGGNAKTEEFIYPVSRLALHGQFIDGKESGGLIIMIRSFLLIAFFIILIACINFMNLSTAYSQRRAKEVGIRKVTGALQSSLLIQFLGESLLTAFFAGIVALGMIQLALPAFDRFTQTPVHIDYHDLRLWAAFFGYIAITGILAGSYPAFVLASFKPVFVLKGRLNSLLNTSTPRKILVVFQFSIAIALIISTVIVMRQVDYAQRRDTGFNRDRLINVTIYSDGIRPKFDRIRNELLASGAATHVTSVFSPLTDNWASGLGLKYEGYDPNEKIQVNRYAESGDLVRTAGMQLLTGRDIDLANYPTDSTACLLNEAASKYMRFRNPIGQLITDNGTTFHVIGVIKNYIQESPYHPIRPMLIAGPARWTGGAILVRLNGDRPIKQDLTAADKIFRSAEPLYPFEYSFVNEDYAAKFNIEQFVGRIAGLFTALTIFISCLGLFGLAAYTARARKKEIGIRKVLGASVSSISLLLSKDFVKLITLSILVAIPVAWLTMENWLSSYDYRIPITWDIFAIAGASALFIALATVSYQAVRAGLSNPVKNLRNNE